MLTFQFDLRWVQFDCLDSFFPPFFLSYFLFRIELSAGWVPFLLWIMVVGLNGDWTTQFFDFLKLDILFPPFSPIFFEIGLRYPSGEHH